jgi:hypothetical protein
MVALRTYDDLPPPTPDGYRISALDAASVPETEAWLRFAAAAHAEPRGQVSLVSFSISTPGRGSSSTLPQPNSAGIAR